MNSCRELLCWLSLCLQHEASVHKHPRRRAPEHELSNACMTTRQAAAYEAERAAEATEQKLRPELRGHVIPNCTRNATWAADLEVDVAGVGHLLVGGRCHGPALVRQEPVGHAHRRHLHSRTFRKADLNFAASFKTPTQASELPAGHARVRHPRRARGGRFLKGGAAAAAPDPACTAVPQAGASYKRLTGVLQASYKRWTQAGRWPARFRVKGLG